MRKLGSSTKEKQMSSASEIDPTASLRAWKSFRLIGGIAALIAAILFRRWLSAEFDMLKALGIIHFQLHVAPSTPIEWLSLLHTNAFVGLLLLNVFDLVNYLLAALMYLGIYSLLRNHEKAYLRFATILALAGVAVYIASNQALNLLSLSNQYYVSTSDVQKPMVLAAAQYALTVNDPVVFGTGTFWSYILFYSSGLMLAIGMVKSNLISKWIGIVGIIANAFGLGYFFTSIFSSSLSIIPAVGSAPLNLVWYIAVGIHLIKSFDKKI
jgi:hypothetical protein